MINFLTSFFGKTKSENIQYIDPKTILFSTPTLSDDLAPLEPLCEKPSDKDFGFHEDEWCQIEFFPKSQLATIQQTLKEYKQFEQAHRVQQGWSRAYLRKIQRIPVLSASHPLEKVERLFGIKAGPAPILFTFSEISGRVKNGFTIPLGGNIIIYGYVDNDYIPVLGANVGKNPNDSRLIDAFMKLNASDGLLLVDWCAQLLITEASSASEVDVWRP